jgi:hypothetical protein
MRNAIDPRPFLTASARGREVTMALKYLAEFTARRSLLDFSCDSFCEFVRIEFVFGSERQASSVLVPIGAYNNEVSARCCQIPKLFPDIDYEHAFPINLPLVDIP